MDDTVVAADPLRGPSSPPPGWEDPQVFEFMMAEYRAYQSSLAESEKGGETRLNFHLTVATAALGALVLRERGIFTAPGRVDPIVYFLLAAVLLFGTATLGRLIHRNLHTDTMLRALGRIRGWFCRAHPLDEYLTWKAGAPPPRAYLAETDLFVPRKGGMVETVIQLNACVAAAIGGLAAVQAAAALGAGESAAAGVFGGVLGFVGVGLAQVDWVNRRYAVGRGDGRPETRNKAEAHADG